MNTRYKYPRTYHLSWSPGCINDDKMLDSIDHFIGKEIVVTEKCDGECFQSKTKVRMFDDNVLYLGNIVKNNLVGQYVWGVDSTNRVVPSKITRTYFNGNTADWVCIKLKGKHSKYQKIVCTPTHRMITSIGEVEAKDLKEGDVCYTIDNDVEITSIQTQVLLGKLLGDGSFHPRKRKTENSWDSKKANIQFSHKQTHMEYVNWTKQWLGNISVNSCVDDFPRYGNTIMVKSWTINTHSIYNQFQDMIVNGVKTVPEWIIDVATPVTLAFWYMDDGNLNHSANQQDRMIISVCGFDEDSCKVLQSLLLKFGIVSTIHSSTGYRYLYINHENANNLSELIAPYIHESMKYKLPECYRDVICIEPPKLEPLVSYKFLREVSVISIEHNYQSKYSGKYDIETETHNYFANGTLVHNCTTMYNDYIHARSIDSKHHSSRDYVKAVQGGIAHCIPEGWRICGENMYALHSIPYDNLESYFLAFSIWNEHNICLDWDTTVDYCKNRFGIKHVPVLWRGIFDQNYLELGLKLDSNKQEGYVIRITDSFRYNDFEKSVAKYVRPKHITTDEHWMSKEVIPNKLKKL